MKTFGHGRPPQGSALTQNMVDRFCFRLQIIIQSQRFEGVRLVFPFELVVVDFESIDGGVGVLFLLVFSVDMRPSYVRDALVADIGYIPEYLKYLQCETSISEGNILLIIELKLNVVRYISLCDITYISVQEHGIRICIFRRCI